jgi:malate synthase
LFDFGLYLFHNAREVLRRGSGPYFCLPKIESRHEAALWRDVFAEAEALLNLPVGAIRATVIIETLPAAFEMDEILYELRDRAIGLACGRRDYLFSMIKVLGAREDFIVPEYAGVTMMSPALRAFSRLLVATCRRRGAQAIGAVAAQRLTPGTSAANEAVLIKVSADKAREAGECYDGISVAHPELAPAARAAFDAARGCAKTLCLPDEAVTVKAADLLARPEGRITESGVREAIRVAIRTIEAWLRGRRCESLTALIEDAAAAEVRRAQVWQWRRHGVQLDGGKKVDADMIIRMAREETAAFRDGEFPGARKLFLALCLSDEFKPFLTTAAYPCLLAAE